MFSGHILSFLSLLFNWLLLLELLIVSLLKCPTHNLSFLKLNSYLFFYFLQLFPCFRELFPKPREEEHSLSLIVGEPNMSALISCEHGGNELAILPKKECSFSLGLYILQFFFCFRGVALSSAYNSFRTTPHSSLYLCPLLYPFYNSFFIFGKIHQMYAPEYSKYQLFAREFQCFRYKLENYFCLL